ncbi:MAG: KR domain-containing protein, partial [Verrucomicrobia bacterium]|nr:KR domain-containing protein [Verrucomicrobiota bacterium]
AGVLDDGVLTQQNGDRFATVFAPKVNGSMILHRLTASDRLDFCVFFSSIASVFGSPGQGNYVAANGFMDTLAAARNIAGKPSVSINWGAWSGAGVAVDRGLVSHAQETGYGVIDPRSGFRALEAALSTDRSQVTVFPVDWPRFLQRTQRGGYSPAFLSEFTGLGSRLGSNESNGQTGFAGAVPPGAGIGPLDSLHFRDRLNAVPPNRRRSTITEQIRREVAHVLGLQDLVLLPNNKPLNELGLDSLMAVELRNRLGDAVEHTLPATLLFDYPTVDGLTDYLSRTILKLEEAPAESPRPSAPISAGLDVLSEIENLDDAEIDRLLEGKGIRSSVSE